LSKRAYESEETLQQYKEAIVEIMQMFNASNRFLASDVENMVQFETKLARV
jgi:hypothetical protein